MITIDFETRSKCDLKKAGAWRYSKDESTDVLCLAYKLPGKPTRVWSPFFEDFESGGAYKMPKDLEGAILQVRLSDDLIEAHNSFFEYCIWNNVLAPKYKWPKIPLEKFRDSAAKAAALALPRNLEQLGTALGLPIQKDMTGRRLMLKMSKPRKPTKTDKSEWHEKPEDFIRLLEYCKTDVDTEEAASKIMEPHPFTETPLWLFDQEINARGVPIDVKLVKKALSFLDQYSEELISELVKLTDGEITSPGQLKRIIAWLEPRGVVTDSLAKDKLEEILKDHTLPDDVRRVLEIRQLLSKSSTKKLESMLACADVLDNRVRGTLLFHGASTGRWSGRLIQPQNFPRGSLKGSEVEEAFKRLKECRYREFKRHYPDLLDVVSSMLRGFISTPEGKEFLAADFSSIESRALFWLADEENGLEVYRTHGKIYEDMAATIYNTSPDKILSGSFERQLGKQAVLGCGFGMGGDKFQVTCEGYGMDVSKELAKFTVQAFRGKFPKVVQMWKELEDAAVKAVKNPGTAYKANKIAYKVVNGFLWCKLPSGRFLAYYKPRLKMKETPWGEMKAVVTYMGLNSQTRKWERQSTYGGKLCENVTQAVARDLMAHAMTELDKNGYYVIMTVHDEVVTEIPEGFGSLNEFEMIMNEVPPWALNLPVESESWRGRRFKK